MCGIVGYIGKNDAYNFLIQGLKKLEYRGYDSAGIALETPDGHITTYKSLGKVSKLEELCQDANIKGHTGIGHTRWATHGIPSDRNAHPHSSADGRITLVHNGTIENYLTIKDTLTAAGYEFQSDTDSEVLAQWISYQIATTGATLENALTETLKIVEGAYALAILEKSHPDRIVVAKKSSPLALGLSSSGTYIASDATPFVGLTDKVIYLDDGEIGIVTPTDITISDLKGNTIKPQPTTLDMTVEQLEKGGYDSFMLKEIHEQPARLADSLRGRIDSNHHIHLDSVETNIDVFRRVRRIVIVACGTSWHAGLIGKRLIQDFCNIPVEVEYASEFRYGKPVLSPDDIIIAISQSGETADTLAAISLARKHGAFVYYICNVLGSSIPRQSNAGTYIHVGPEVGVASTKAFTGQVMTLAMLALNVSQIRGTLTDSVAQEIGKYITAIPDKVAEALKQEEAIAAIARHYTDTQSYLYLGRGYCYPAALEGALKLKEISYAHAEGYPAAEMKHGPIALIDETLPCVVIAPTDSLYDKVVSTIQQIKSRNGKVIAIATTGNRQITTLADDVIYIPPTHESLTPILASIPLQLMAYYVATYRGLNVDQPRNLAKSVTVE